MDLSQKAGNHETETLVKAPSGLQDLLIWKRVVGGSVSACVDNGASQPLRCGEHHLMAAGNLH
jgi:hypothetical protein